MRYAAALLGAAVLVAGCGGSKSGSKSDGVAKAATTTPTPTATPQSDGYLLKIDAAMNTNTVAAPPQPALVLPPPSTPVGPVMRPASFERNPLLPKRP